MTEPTANAAFPKCYRLRRYYLVVGIPCTVFFGAMGCLSTGLALSGVGGVLPNPRFAALIVGVFWSAFSALGLYIILGYVRHRLHVSDSSLTAVGCFSTRTLQLVNVQRMDWRVWPQGGSVVLRDATTRIVVELANYTPEERDELIAYFRNRVDTQRQEGWPRFVDTIVERRPLPMRPSRIAAVLCAMALGVLTIACLYNWWIGLGVKYLVVGILNAVGCVAYSFSVALRWTHIVDDAQA